MEAIVLTYNDGSWKSRSYAVRSIKGMDDPDDCRITGVQHEYLNGGIEEEILGFQRYLTVDFGVLHDPEDRRFILNFLQNESRRVTASSFIAYVALAEPERFTNEWLNNIRLLRRFTLRLIDSNIYTVWPVYVPAVAGEIMYVKNKVKIENSPETFTTNDGKLVADETSNPYPTFNDATHVFHVSVDGAPYQEAKIYLIAKPTVVDGDITFQLGISQAGGASSDGFYYADIAIFLQAIPE